MLVWEFWISKIRRSIKCMLKFSIKSVYLSPLFYSLLLYGEVYHLNLFKFLVSNHHCKINMQKLKMSKIILNNFKNSAFLLRYNFRATMFTNIWPNTKYNVKHKTANVLSSVFCFKNYFFKLYSIKNYLAIPSYVHYFNLPVSSFQQ